MRKRILICIIIGSFLLGGCRVSSDLLLSYEETVSVAGYSLDNNLTQVEYSTDKIVAIPEAEVTGGDELLMNKASLLIDVTDRKALYADEIYEKYYPASLTKLMTALIVLRYYEDYSDIVTVSYHASHIPESGARLCGFEEGDQISMDTLLHSLLIYSGNDAAIAIADHLEGSEVAFVEVMNAEAAKIGAVHTSFKNCTGLHDDNHYTTAYDIYMIFNELLEYEAFREIIRLQSYTAVYKDRNGDEKQKALKSTNLYFTGEKELEPALDLEILGGKTGTTSKAGNCLILLCKDTKGKEYIAEILNASDHDQLYLQMSYLLSLTAVE